MSSDIKPGWLDIPTIRDRLNSIDGLMLRLLAERAYLVREVGKIKHSQGQSLQASDREAAMFARMQSECESLHLNFDYIAELWSTMIYYAKVMECEEVGIESFLNKKPVPTEELRGGLLALTEITAPQYDAYCDGDGANAASAYRRREIHRIRHAIGKGLPGSELALDLGCATGQITEELEGHFSQVCGFDISPHMCAEGFKRRTWRETTSFAVADIEKRIPVDDNCVDFLVANFGCASELGPNLLSETKRVLKPGGKAVLSYYNTDSLLNRWFYPWPSTVRARLNPHNNTVEVWTNNKVFTIHAVGTTVKELEVSLRCSGLEVVDGNIETYPTFQAIVPRFFFTAKMADSQEMVHIAEEIDSHLAKSRSGMYRGTYILVEVKKK